MTCPARLIAFPSGWKLRVLRQSVGDGVPGRLVAHPDVGSRVEGGAVVEGAVDHVDPLAWRENREEQRAAAAAVDVVGVVAAVAQDVHLAARHAHRHARDAAERLEGRPCRPPAVRAVAVLRIGEGVSHFIADGAAVAAARQGSRGGHGGREIGHTALWQRLVLSPGGNVLYFKPDRAGLGFTDLFPARRLTGEHEVLRGAGIVAVAGRAGGRAGDGHVQRGPVFRGRLQTVCAAAQ